MALNLSKEVISRIQTKYPYLDKEDITRIVASQFVFVKCRIEAKDTRTTLLHRLGKFSTNQGYIDRIDKLIAAKKTRLEFIRSEKEDGRETTKESI
jgi:hypothetical protein